MHEVAAPPIVAVGGIVFRHNPAGQVEILLIRKRAGFWTLPKGRVEPNEAPRHAVQREVFEETGMRGDVVAAVARIAYEIVKRGEVRPKRVTYYLLRATQGVLRPDDDEGIVEVRWFPLDGALAVIGRDKIRAVVASAIPHLSPQPGASSGEAR